MQIHRNTNRLADETSPYLLQHAHNPVDWHPWGAKAFEIARQRNQLIFLSVGYSTCYWCHVMERQCFENDAIAAEMNKRFVSIKVDREERPDVDQLYMTALQVMAGQGGWPMSVFLTPDLRPFYAGTYFPPNDSGGRPGFGRLLAAVDEAFRKRPNEINDTAHQIVEILRQTARPGRPSSAVRMDSAWVQRLIEQSAGDFDSVHGGFGAAPKFPRQTLLELILVYLAEHPDAELLRRLRMSLDAMAHGGIRDHLGGGFHRYSTDAEWLVPHFEIMLYDNAMLLWVYAEAHRQTGEARYAAVARGIGDFVLREMTSPASAFYTAFDAEVDAEEGGCYLWTRDQVRQALAEHASAGDVERFLRVYGLEDGPNFADPHLGNGMPDKNVLYLAEPGEGARSALLDPRLRELGRMLYDVRRERKQPLLDTKILTSWNALMIRGLAHAGRILREPRYLQAANTAADYLLQHHRDADGGLLRTSIGAAAKHPAFLDDYAFLVQALLVLGDANNDPTRNGQARELAGIMQKRFYDSAGGGGFFYTDRGADDLIVRQMVGSDSPLPSGNGVAAMAMLTLDRGEMAAGTVSAFAAQLNSVGEGMSALVQAALMYVRQIGELNVAAGDAPPSDRPLSPAELAGRVVTIQAEWLDPLRLSVKCTVLNGFHVNAHDVASPWVPMRVAVDGPAGQAVDTVEYPPGKLHRPAFAEGELALYEGQFAIVVKFKSVPASGTKVELTLSYQACDDRACLPTAARHLAVVA